MTTFSLGQKWVSQITKSDLPDVPIIGANLSPQPDPAEFKEFFAELARSDTAREMSRRKWITPRATSVRDKVAERSTALFEFFSVNTTPELAYAMFKGRRLSAKRSLIDEIATTAWIAHITSAAQEQVNNVVFQASRIDDEFVRHLVRLSPLEDGPRRALDAVREIGIRVVTESGLPGMSVDGASLHTKDTGPVLAMTLRHDRLDNFWFTLLHEIGHIALHLNQPSNDVFVDSEEEENEESELEAEANAFAKDSLIPRDVWLRSDAHRRGDEGSVINLAKQLKIHAAIVAGRIRFEREEFRIFNDVIGFGEVRSSIFRD